jgi:simple sugar transport system ATP-binding protein
VLVTRTEELAKRFGMELDADRAVWQLPVGQQQQVEILRVLVRGARVLILDEPTAVLTPPEVAALEEVIRRVCQEGTSVVYISHKLPEVLRIASRITVMRRGRRIDTLDRSQVDVDRVATMMVGGALEPPEPQPRPAGDVVVEVRGLEVADDAGRPAVNGVDLTVRAGEILAIAGVAGNGQRELAEAIAGVRPRGGGEVRIEGGCGFVPEDRRGLGLVPLRPIWENAILRTDRSPGLRRGPLLRAGAGRALARQIAEGVRLSTSDPDVPVAQLSGGHQQRLLIGREMSLASRAIVLAYPTRGLDVRAVQEMRAAVLEERARGKGILLISEDLDEVLEFSDRLAVMYQGRIVHEARRAEADRGVVGAAMAGMTREESA